MPVAGLDLARRSDHSALVLLDVEPGRLTVAGVHMRLSRLASTTVRNHTSPRPSTPAKRFETAS